MGRNAERLLIVDVGLHQGQDAEFYLGKGFRVVGVEANPELVRDAERRFEPYIRSGQLHVIQRAISSKPGPVEFFVNRTHQEWNSTSLAWAARLNDPIEQVYVDTITIEEIVRTHGIPYYVKIDIEGEDTECLRQLLRAEITPEYLSVEADTVDFTGAALDEQFDLLERLGYRKFQIVNQAVNSRRRPPNPALEGEHCDFAFKWGSSGLFGRELPGRWMSSSRLRRSMHRRLSDLRSYGLAGNRRSTWRARIYRRVKILSRDPLAWYDIHCTR